MNAGPLAEAFGAGTYEPLTHNRNNPVTDGIWRVSGRPEGSVVLKVCTPRGTGTWESGSGGEHWNYWQREPLAYRHGLATEAYAEAGITAPALLSAEDRPDGSVALWLEDVTGTPGFGWDVAYLGRFARRLGAAQAHWAGREAPHDWLSRGWLRQYVASKPLAGRPAWDHPTAAAAWPEDLRDGLRRMWEQRETLLAATEAAPRTLCHLDVWPMNMIAAGGGDVLLDWSFVGDGALGEDIANLIVDSVADGHMPSDLLPEICETVQDGYLAGLREAGRPVDEAALRRTVAAAGAAKYCWLAPMILGRLAAGTPLGTTTYDVGGDDTAVLARGVPLMRHLVAWSESALG